MIIYGWRLYGHTDEIPGLGYVATRFVHIWYVPLFPFGSVFVTGESEGSTQGVSVGLSFKSVLAVWTRAAMVLLTLGGIGASVWGAIDVGNRLLRLKSLAGLKRVAGVELFTSGAAAGGGLCFAAVAVAVFILTGTLTRTAGRRRRAELLARLGVPDPDAHVLEG